MELAPRCYENMFDACENMLKAPMLPAKTLVEKCYSGMFFDCLRLNYVKAMFTEVLSEDTTANWLTRVPSTGTFVKSKDATWNVKDCGIPEGWTIITE